MCESERGRRAVAERVKFSRVERALPMWDLTAGRVQRAVCGEAYPAAQPGPGLPDMNTRCTMSDGPSLSTDFT